MCVKISVSCNIKPASLAGSVTFNSYNTYRKKVISESGKLEIYLNCKIKKWLDPHVNAFKIWNSTYLRRVKFSYVLLLQELFIIS